MMLREIHQIGKGTREFLVHPGLCPMLARHRITLAGISLTSPKFHFVRLRPDMAQILVCFRGEGQVWVDGGWRKCSAGTAYLTPSVKFHAYRARRGWEAGWVTCRADSPCMAAIRNPTMLDVDPRPLEYILQGLHQEVSTRREPGMLEHWSELLHGQVRRMAEPRQSSRLWHVWEAVQQNPGAGWDLPGLARLAKLGPEQVRRLCLRETGRSPMQHLTHLRVQHTVSMLASGQKIEEVARAVGYENAFAFSTAFKRVMGQPPSAFRQQA